MPTWPLPQPSDDPLQHEGAGRALAVGRLRGRLWRSRAGASLRAAHGLHELWIIGAFARPNWQERQPQESLTRGEAARAVK